MVGRLLRRVLSRLLPGDHLGQQQGVHITLLFQQFLDVRVVLTHEVAVRREVSHVERRDPVEGRGRGARPGAAAAALRAQKRFSRIWGTRPYVPAPRRIPKDSRGGHGKRRGSPREWDWRSLPQARRLSF